MTGHGRLLSLFTALTLVFLLAPVVVIIIFSFNDSPSLSFPIEGLSLRWFEKAANNQVMRIALGNSITVAAIALLVVVVIATPASWYIAKTRSPLATLLLVLMIMPLTLPGLFIGIALLNYFGRLDVKPSIMTVAVAHVLYTMGFYVLIASRRLASLDPAFGEAATMLGASRLQTARLVIWPLIRPAVLAALALCLALSLDEFVITFFVVGPENTLPIVIFSNIRTTVTPEINAVATFLLVVSWISVGAALLIGRRRGLVRDIS